MHVLRVSYTTFLYGKELKMFNALLVDDEPAITDNLFNIVPWKEFGFDRVGTATGGAEALDWMAQQECHLLITDIKMAGMDGLELLKIARSLYPAIHCVILSAYNEFEYAQVALRLGADNYLLKPINITELIATIKDITGLFYLSFDRRPDLSDMSSAFKENTLSGWVSGRLQGHELSERAGIVNINIFSRSYRVLCLKVINGNGYDSELAEEIDTELSIRYDCYRFVDSSATYVYILGGREVDAFLVKECVKSVIGRYNESVMVFGAIGMNAAGSTEVSTSYISTSELIHFNMLFPKNEVVLSEMLRQEAFQIPQVDSEVFFHLIYESTEEDILLATRDMVQHILNHASDSMEATKAQIINLLLHIVQEAKRNLRPNQELPASMRSLLGKLDHIKTRSALVEWLCSVMVDTRRVIQQELDTANPVIRRVLTQIKDHFDQPMSIKSLSTDININPSYLGFLFKQETGLYFSDYLNSYRIRAAERLLTGTDLNIRDIASKVGYADASYFNQIFHKQHGVSPAKYRLLRHGMK